MLKKTIKYTDYNGNVREEDFYFNLNESEVIEMEMGINGGMTALIEKIVKEQNAEQIIKLFKDIIAKAYGEKTLDGRGFDKSPEVLRRFTQTEAYNALFMELLDAEKASAFIKAILPKNKEEAAKKGTPQIPSIVSAE